MPLIVYRGHTPVVSVPTHQLDDVERDVPVEVPDHVAADLTLGGTSAVWHLVDALDHADNALPPNGSGDDEDLEG